MAHVSCSHGDSAVTIIEKGVRGKDEIHDCPKRTRFSDHFDHGNGLPNCR